MATSFCTTSATWTAGGGGVAGAAALWQAAFTSRGTTTRARFKSFIAIDLFTLRAETQSLATVHPADRPVEAPTPLYGGPTHPDSTSGPLGGAPAGARARTRPDHAAARGSGRRSARPDPGRADGGGTHLAPRHRHRPSLAQRPSARPRPQGDQAVEHPGERRERRGTAHSFRHRIATSTGAAIAGTSRGHRGDARLHGARTNGANEPLDRFPG